MNKREQLQSLITKKAVSVAKLARLADIHQQTIYNYLSSKSSISVDNYEKLENILFSL